MKKRDFIRTSGMLALGSMILPHASYSNSLTRQTGASLDLGDVGLGGMFTLPDLPYAYDALEPYIDKQTMMIHHDKHHAGYVRKLNKALEGMDVEGKSLEDIVSHVDPDNSGVRNNGGGHYNHSLFWKVMSPGGGNAPEGKLGDAIKSTFGSYDGFKETFANAAGSRFGSGWAWLSVDADGKLFVSSTPNQDNPMMTNVVEQNGMPILGIDVWEHAYYLKYQNKRSEYIGNFFNIINWEAVAANYAAIG